MAAQKKHPIRDSKVVGALAKRMFPPAEDGAATDEELREITDGEKSDSEKRDGGERHG